jgi:predicted HicB family RNase H-like nuclease
MARLTVRLPNSLHSRLSERAKHEGVSMNQYVVLALGRVVTSDEISDQKAAFDALLHRYPEAEAEAALQALLAERS